MSEHDPSAPRAPSSVRSDAVALVVITALCSLLVFGVVGHSSRLTQSWHGLFHTAIVHQLVHGIVPPTNPLSVGAPVGYPWFWHLGLATLVRVLDVPPFTALLVASALSLATLLGAMWMGSRALTAGRWGRAAACLLPLVIVNPVGPLRFLASVVVDGRAVVQPTMNYLLPVDELFGVALDGRAGSPLAKFLNFNGMPAGIALFAVAVVFLSSRRSRSPVRCVFGVVLGFVLALVYPHAGGAAGIAAFAAGLVTLAERGRPDEDGLLRRLAPPIAIAAGLALAAPLLLSVTSGFGDETPDRRGVAENLVAVGWALVPLLPLFALGAALVRRLPTASRFHLLCGALLALAALKPLPVETQYKFPLLASVPASLLLLGIGRALLPDPPARGALARRVAGAGAALGLAAGALVVTASVTLRLDSVWAASDPFVFDGSATNLAAAADDDDRAQRQQAYAWIRDHTPATRYVLELPVDMNSLELTAVTERRVVAALPTVFTDAVPYQPYLSDMSRNLVSRLGACAATVDDVARLFAVPAPWPLEIHAVARMHDGHGTQPACTRLPGVVTSVFASGRYAVFRIRAPAPAVSETVRAADRRPGDVAAQYAAANELQLAGDLAGSLPYLERIHAVGPGYERSLFLEGWALQRLGRWSEAEQRYQSFVEQQPDHVQSRFNLACGLAGVGRHDEAIEHLHEVIHRDAENFRSAHHWLAESYAAIGDDEAATRHRTLYREARARAGSKP